MSGTILGPDLDGRLLSWAQTRGMDVGVARLRLVYERLLARMDVAASLRWVVRGGRAIDLRFDGHARRTLDLDISVDGAAPLLRDELALLLGEVCDTDLGDGWNIGLTRIQRSLVRHLGVVGYKVWLGAGYQNRPSIDVSLDVSKTSTSTIRPEVLFVDEMLIDARIRVAVARPEVVIAEKVFILSGPTGPGTPPMRSYDLVDAVALVLAGGYDRATLRTAAEETFATRGRQLARSIPAAPPEWSSAFQTHGVGYGLTHLSTDQGVAILSAAWERAVGGHPRRTLTVASKVARTAS